MEDFCKVERIARRVVKRIYASLEKVDDASIQDELSRVGIECYGEFSGRNGVWTAKPEEFQEELPSIVVKSDGGRLWIELEGGDRVREKLDYHVNRHNTVVGMLEELSGLKKILEKKIVSLKDKKIDEEEEKAKQEAAQENQDDGGAGEEDAGLDKGEGDAGAEEEEDENA